MVKTKSKTAAKLINKGTMRMMAGHADQNNGDCYRVWDPLRHYVHVTRDVIWLKRMHYKKLINHHHQIMQSNYQKWSWKLGGDQSKSNFQFH